MADKEHSSKVGAKTIRDSGKRTTIVGEIAISGRHTEFHTDNESADQDKISP